MVRRLVVVLGDQLDEQSLVFDGFNVRSDVIWMCEAPAEAQQVWSHKARIALFLSAMRHFRDRLQSRGWQVIYRSTDEHAHRTLAEALADELATLSPSEVVMVKAGEWRLNEDFIRVVAETGVPLRFVRDRHFLLDEAQFESWIDGRLQPRLETFYRWMRRRTGLLMEGGEPAGGSWNYDSENRESFGREPPRAPPRLRFLPDTLTKEVLHLVERRYSSHPGELAEFDWPVTREDALEALNDFIQTRLPDFGRWQDAMWTGEAWLWHSHISAALNLKLLDPREVCEAAIAAWKSGSAPISSVEGFVRQLLGWREFVRAIYWRRMPGYLTDNALGAHVRLPEFYWTGQTDYACLADAIGQTLKFGYAHHIQRLMVTGLFSLLLGVEPRHVHEWYLAVYVDAVEWVELPNTMGMSQYADGGIIASKPYVASGKYIQRMSNACESCRYDPSQSVGPGACPFTTLYWDFLDRHESRFGKHPRLATQVMNLRRKTEQDRALIRLAAARLRERLGSGPGPA